VAFSPLFRGKRAAPSTYTGGGDGTCTNISCHGGQATPNWSTGAIDPATQCTVCHIREAAPDRATATEHNSAVSGLHAVTTTVSGKDHWADPAATCGGAGACHAGPPANHFGANLLDNAMAELTTANAGMRPGIAVSAGPGHDPNRDTCAVACHLDGGRWARQNDKGRAALPIDDAGVCATCHGTPATGWTAGAGVLSRPDMTGVGGPAAMAAGHDNDWNADGVSGEVTSGNNHNVCGFCHGMNSRGDRHANYLAATMWDPTGATSDHGNGRITMNGPSAAINAGNNAAPAGMEYNGNDDNTTEASDYSCTNACHYGAGNANHNMGRSGWPLQYRDFGGGSCADCHGPGGSGPQVVWPAGNRAAIPNVTQGTFGSHLVATKTDPVFSGSTDWRTQCNKCHTGHGGPGVNARIPMPPAIWNNNNGLFSVNMQLRLGFDNGAGSWSYAKEGGIWIGGTATTGGTEAEICWNCHGLPANQVSEWGYNTKTTPAGYPVAQFATQSGEPPAETFHFGWIYTSISATTKTPDWRAGYWMDAYDNAIRRRIASIHSASFDPAGQVSSVQANVDANGVVNRTTPVLEDTSYIRCSYCHDVHDLGAAQGPPPDTPNKGKPFLRGNWVGNPYPPELPPRSGYAYTTRVNIVGPATPRALSTSRDKGGYFIDQNSNWPTDNPAMNSYESTAGLCQLCHGTNVDSMDFYTGGSKLWLGSMSNGHSNSTLGGTRSNARDIFTGSRYGAGMGMQWNVPIVPSYSCEFGCDGNYPQSGMMSGSENQQYLLNSGWFGGPVGTFTQGGGDFANWYGNGTIGGAQGPGSMAHKFTCSKCHSPHATGLPALLTHNCIDPAGGNFTVYGSGGTNLIANNCHRKTTLTDGWHRLAPAQ
jgi:predicted CxxxxCH...CXXCH cytochrome family protein